MTNLEYLKSIADPYDRYLIIEQKIKELRIRYEEYYNPKGLIKKEYNYWLNSYRFMADQNECCPFCGAKTEDNIVVVTDIERGYFVQCIFCGARSAYYSSEKLALKAWNRRIYK